MPADIAPPAHLARNVRVFGITSFLNDTASEMAYWILPAFLATLGAGPMQLGIIEGIAESVASIAKLWSGNLADKLPRRKPLVVGGYALANLAKPLLALTTAWWQVLAIRFSDRLAKGIRQAPRDVLLAESVDARHIGSAFGLLQAMDSAGAIAGPLLALWILQTFSHDPRYVFWAAAIPGVLAIIVVATFARETKPVADIAPSALVKAKLAPADLPRSFWFVLTVVTIFSLGNSSDMFLILRANDVGIPIVAAPLLGLVFNVVYTLGSWPAGRLSDRVPRRFVAAAGYFVFAATYIAFADARNHALLWTMMGFYGLYYALTNPVLKALVVETVPPASRGRALGIFYFATSVTTLLASLIAGYLWRTLGAPTPFYFSAALAAAAGVALLFFHPRPAPVKVEVKAA